MSTLLKTVSLLQSILTVAFWGLLIFGFDRTYIAFLTLISAIIHEIGHLLVLRILGIRAFRYPRGVINGLRIKKTTHLSYRDEALVSLGGPLINLALGIFLMLPFNSEYLTTFGALNVMTAISNLLPIEGYDGHKILSAILLSRSNGIKHERALITLSLVFSAILTFFSLFLILSLGEGFWIFAIFFYSFLASLYKRKKHAFFEKTRENERF